MSIYPDAPTLYRVMEQVCRRAMTDPEAAKSLQESRVVVRLVTSDPDAELTLDATSSPVEVSKGAGGPLPDVSLFSSCDVLHRVWSGELALRDAYFGGQIRVDGSPLQLLALLPRLERFFRVAESLYPVVFREVVPSMQLRDD